MALKVRIEVKLPDEIADVYQGEYILRQLQEVLLGKWIELPHPDVNANAPMKVDVESISISWVGSD